MVVNFSKYVFFVFHFFQETKKENIKYPFFSKNDNIVQITNI